MKNLFGPPIKTVPPKLDGVDTSVSVHDCAEATEVGATASEKGGEPLLLVPEELPLPHNLWLDTHKVIIKSRAKMPVAWRVSTPLILVLLQIVLVLMWYYESSIEVYIQVLSWCVLAYVCMRAHFDYGFSKWCLQPRLNVGHSEIGFRSIYGDFVPAHPAEARSQYWANHAKFESEFEGHVYTKLSDALVASNISTARRGFVHTSRLQVMLAESVRLLKDNNLSFDQVDNDVLINTVGHSVARVELASHRLLSIVSPKDEPMGSMTVN